MKVENWTVIVVEDTFERSGICVRDFSHHGVEVHVAHNGVECLTLLDTVKPTCIITDSARNGRMGNAHPVTRKRRDELKFQ